MKKSYFVKFLVTFISVLVVSVAALALICFFYSKMQASKVSVPSVVIEGAATPSEAAPTGLIKTVTYAPPKTAFLIMGVDEGAKLSDTVMVGCFDSRAMSIDIIDIPRDTHVHLDSATLKNLRSQGINCPTDLKLTEFHSYAGDENFQKYLDNLLGIKIDYYANVNLVAFRSIVDAVGGIQMTVRPQGYHYSDPMQNLYINVPGGPQLLNGKQAEGVVRFREDYKLGDIGRISVQQQFMKAFFAQALTKKAVMDNFPAFLGTILKDVDTDFSIEDIPKYAQFITKLSPDNFTMTTLPGNFGTFGDRDTYWIMDPVKTQSLINNVFYSTKYESLDGKLKNFKINLLNGSKVKNLATLVGDEMKADGYNIANVGNFTSTLKKNTIIKVRKNLDVSELSKYFVNPQVEVDETIDSLYDMEIVLGTEEKAPDVATTSSDSPATS